MKYLVSLFPIFRWIMLLLFRRLLIVALGAVIVSFSWGCERYAYKGPKINAFKGRLTQKGEPVSFPENEDVTLRLIYQKDAQSYGVPIHSDGSFQIGWMPIGPYTAILVRNPKKGAANQAPPPNESARRGPPPNKAPKRSMYTLPGEFAIEKGKTEYTIDLGPNWKP